MISSTANSPNSVSPLRACAPLPEFVARRVERFHGERLAATWGGRHILRGRVPAADAILLQSNDYLAITRHPAIAAAQRRVLASEGNGLMMSGLFQQQGDEPMHVLEARLARAVGYDAAVLCQSGYNANVGLVQCIAAERVPVYVDLLAHTSLWEGIRSSGATAVPVMHNDVEHLERQVLRHGPGVILVDSVYSTNGSLAPLRAIADIASRLGSVLVVDESHSLGTHGAHGEGLVASLGLQDRVHFVTASLAKAYCSRAGLIACSRRFADYFAFESLPAIFSSSLLPHELAGLDAAHDVIRTEGWRRTRLHQVARQVRAGLLELGYPVGDGSEQIIALEAGTEPATMILRDALESRGVFGAIFCAPATAKNRALVRLTLHAGLDEPAVARLLRACAEIREEVGLREWSATRRAARGTREPCTPTLAQVA